MEIQEKTNPWKWVGIIALICLFCCCSMIVALAIFGPMFGYYFGPPEGGSSPLPFVQATFVL
jgi:hypothetical protein